MKVLLTTGILAAFASFASAATIPCATGSLASFIGLGATGCAIGNATFSSFGVLSGITGSIPIAPANITVTPNNLSGAVGITVQTNSRASAGQLLEALFGYSVAGSGIVADQVSLSGTTASGGGSVTDIQDFCLGGTFATGSVTGCSSNRAGTLVVLNSGSDQRSFTAVSSISVVHDFTLDAGPDGSATGGMVTDRFTTTSVSTVPEPATFPLVAAMLLAAGGIRRLRRPVA